MLNRKAFIASALALILSFTPILVLARAQEKSPGATQVVALLEKSGYRYTKISETVWEIPGTGQNLKEFGIRVVVAEDIVLVMVKLADRKDLKLEPALLTKLLEMNHHFDTIKVALTDEMLYLRMDMHLRLLDGQELKYIVGQIANATDETYAQVKPFLTTVAK